MAVLKIDSATCRRDFTPIENPSNKQQQRGLSEVPSAIETPSEGVNGTLIDCYLSLCFKLKAVGQKVGVFLEDIYLKTKICLGLEKPIPRPDPGLAHLRVLETCLKAAESSKEAQELFWKLPEEDQSELCENIWFSQLNKKNPEDLSVEDRRCRGKLYFENHPFDTAVLGALRALMVSRSHGL